MDSFPKPTESSHLRDETSPSSASTEARDKRERDSLYAQIENSHRGRQVVKFDEPERQLPKPSTTSNKERSNSTERHLLVYGNIDVEGYNEGDPPRTPLATSRAESPFTQHPTIDFDNLSWPSK
jgi:GTP cyclohydrolase I